MTFLKNDKLKIGGTPSQILFLANFCLKKSLVLRLPWVYFLSQKTQKWHSNCPKTYWYLALGKLKVIGLKFYTLMLTAQRWFIYNWLLKFQEFYHCYLSRYVQLFILKLLIHILYSYLILANDVFICSSVHKLSFFLSWLSGYHIMAFLLHKWKPLKTNEQAQIEFFLLIIRIYRYIDQGYLNSLREWNHSLYAHL